MEIFQTYMNSWMFYYIKRIYINHTLRDNNREGKGWSPQIIDSEWKARDMHEPRVISGVHKDLQAVLPAGWPVKVRLPCLQSLRRERREFLVTYAHIVAFHELSL